MMRTKAMTASVLALLLAVGGATIPWSGGASAAPGSKCRELSGTITLVDSDPWSGTAAGSYAGAVLVTDVVNDFSSDNIRSVIFMTITSKTGAERLFAMDIVARNWTATGLIGGGLLSELSQDPADPGTIGTSHVILGPMEDRFGAPRTFTYDNKGFCKLNAN